MSLNVITCPDELIYIAEKLKEAKKQSELDSDDHCDIYSETLMCNELIISFYWKPKDEKTEQDN